MKHIMQMIFQLLGEFMEDGYYDILNNIIVFSNQGKTYKLRIEEVDSESE